MAPRDMNPTLTASFQTLTSFRHGPLNVVPIELLIFCQSGSRGHLLLLFQGEFSARLPDFFLANPDTVSERRDF